MDGGAYHAFGLDDVGGPPIEREPWSSLRSAIYVLAREIYMMDVTFSIDAIVLMGSVTSERVKAAIAALFSGHAGSVRNELEVAAPFEPAGGILSARTLVADEDGTVTRHPSITPGEAAHPGQAFEFTVDLGSTAGAGTQGAPVALSGLPPGWTEVRVDVEVFCDSIAFDDEEGRFGAVVVFPDGTSRPWAFRGCVRPDAAVGTTFRLMVTFEHGGRHAGSAVRHIPVEQGFGTPQRLPGTASTAIASGSLRLVQGVPPATLMVKIIAASAGKWTWSLSATGGGPYKAARWRDEIDLKQDTLGFARTLLRQCPGLRPGRNHASVLRGIGENIWAATPTCFKDLYGELRERYGSRFPIQIVTDELHVPWEMMHPDANAGFEQADHLFMTHPIARWFGEVGGGCENASDAG